MHWLLAEVRGRDLKKRYRGRNGLEYERYSVRARITGSAVGALAVPDRVVGRDVTLRRDCLRPWAVRKGDLLVLDPVESARALCPREPRPLRDMPVAGAVRVESCDVDRDGFEEDVVANAFVRAVFQGHRGARLSSLSGADATDRLARPFEYIMAGKYVLLGGVEPFVVEGGSPGEIWKSAFERLGTPWQPENGAGTSRSSGRSAAYGLDLESPAGVRLTRSVRVEPWFPGVMETCVAQYSGRSSRSRGEESGVPKAGGPKPGDAAKDETDVTLALRISPATSGDTPSLNMLEIPCIDGLHTVRFHQPGFGRRWRWRDWRDEHFGARGGFLVCRNEGSNGVLAVLWNARRLSYVCTRSDYTGPEIDLVHRTRKLRKGRSCGVGAAYLVGDASAVRGDSLLLASRSGESGGKRHLALVLRTPRETGSVRARVECAGGRRVVALRPISVPEVGIVRTGVLELEADAFPATVTVGSGPESLSLRLEE